MSFSCNSFEENEDCMLNNCGWFPKSAESCSPEDIDPDIDRDAILDAQIQSISTFAIIFILIFIGSCYNGRNNHFLNLNQIASFTGILITISMIVITWTKANSFEPRPIHNDILNKCVDQSKLTDMNNDDKQKCIKDNKRFFPTTSSGEPSGHSSASMITIIASIICILYILYAYKKTNTYLFFNIVIIVLLGALIVLSYYIFSAREVLLYHNKSQINSGQKYGALISIGWLVFLVLLKKMPNQSNNILIGIQIFLSSVLVGQNIYYGRFLDIPGILLIYFLPIALGFLSSNRKIDEIINLIKGYSLLRDKDE